MELEDFIENSEMPDVSTPALLKQREKLNPEVFVELNDDMIVNYYNLYDHEVKTFKGYVLTAIDGSDWEVPNTPESRKNNQVKTEQCARMRVSNSFDLLNRYVLDTQIESYKYSEIKLAPRHIKKAKELIPKFDLITVMDRGYNSISLMYHHIKNNEKFVIRLNKCFFKPEQRKMKSMDEWVEIGYQYDRIRNYKDKDRELYEHYEQGNTIKVRFVNVELDTGEIETLLTNLESSEFSQVDIARIYQLRWGIETHYHHLKENMKVTNISSSKIDLIKQEILSQMLVANLLQAMVNDAEEEIDQEQYKYKMKVNMNMAIGYIKRYMILILLERRRKKRAKMYSELHEKILNQIVPIRDGRTFVRNKTTINKHPINKRKSF